MIVATPLAFVVPEPVIPEGELPMVTGTPAGTGLFAVSLTLTVTVAGLPAKTVAGLTVNVEFAPLTPLTVSVAVWVKSVLPAVAESV